MICRDRQKKQPGRRSNMSRVHAMIRLAGLLLISAGCGVPSVVIADAALEARIDNILSQMTLEEKVQQIYNVAPGDHSEDNTRLGIPGFRFMDCPKGAKGPWNPETNYWHLNTTFPVSTAQAATWDPDLIEQIGQAIGREVRARGFNQGLGPSMDVIIDPRFGRTQESAGEDPYLAGEFAAAVVQGLQSTSLIATTKHLAVYTKEWDRHTLNHIIDERTLVEHYLLPFIMAWEQSDTLCMMTSYHLINGVYTTHNNHMLNDILKSRFGFDGYIISDWASVRDAKQAIEGGCDFDASGEAEHYPDLVSMVSAGQVSLDVVEEAVRRVLRVKIKSGLIDGTQPPPDPNDINNPAHQQLAYLVSQKSQVLLKNENNILPLDLASISRIAVIGPNAAVPNFGDRGSSEVYPPYEITPLEGIEAKAAGQAQVDYTIGCNINDTWTGDFNNAKNLASQSDYVIFVGGLDHTISGENGDRITHDIQLPGKQRDLINELASVNQNLIVVLIGDGGIGLEGCIHNVKGLIHSWYPGMEGGSAIADVIFGDYNPGGKINITFPKNVAQMAPWSLDHTNEIVEGRGYRWFDKQGIEPEFCFGFGLSYTTFSITNLQLSSPVMYGGNVILATVDIQNTGDRLGDEVVQMYIHDVQSSMPMPVKQLKGFKRVTLSPGEQTTVTFAIDDRRLSYYDVNQQRFAVEDGEFHVMIGNSSRNLPLVESLLYYQQPQIPPPADVSATAVSGSEVLITWTDQSHGGDQEDSFIIMRRPYLGNDIWQEIADLPADTESYHDTHVHGGVEYHYLVGACKN